MTGVSDRFNAIGRRARAAAGRLQFFKASSGTRIFCANWWPPNWCRLSTRTCGCGCRPPGPALAAFAVRCGLDGAAALLVCRCVEARDAGGDRRVCGMGDAGLLLDVDCGGVAAAAGGACAAGVDRLHIRQDANQLNGARKLAHEFHYSQARTEALLCQQEWKRSTRCYPAGNWSITAGFHSAQPEPICRQKRRIEKAYLQLECRWNPKLQVPDQPRIQRMASPSKFGRF